MAMVEVPGGSAIGGRSNHGRRTTLGGAMLNGQKNKSPPISIKFGDILESAFDKT